MKKILLSLLILFSFCFVSYADTYSTVEFSPLKATIKNTEYTFKDGSVFYLCLTKEKDIITEWGEYTMFTGLDGAAYFDYKFGSSLLWFMKDGNIIIGWKAIIKDKYFFDFKIVYGLLK